MSNQSSEVDMKMTEPSEQEKMAVAERKSAKARVRKKPDDAMLLLNFGTEREGFTGPQILQAAIADVRKRRRNDQRRAERREAKKEGLPTKGITAIEQYAFLGRHVKAADHPTQIIKAALADRARGELAKGAQTVRLYRSLDGLRAALALAEQQVAPAETVEVERPLPFVASRDGA